jgi:hypothetical protein
MRKNGAGARRELIPFPTESEAHAVRDRHRQAKERWGYFLQQL